MSTHILTTQVPEDIAAKVDGLAKRLGRTKSWVLQHAITEWIAVEEERYRLTREAMRDVRAGNTISQESVSAWVESLGTDHEFPRPSELAHDEN